LKGAVSQRLLESVLVEAREHNLLSEEHFTVDGTLIQAWAAARSFKEEVRSARSGAGSGHKGEVLLRDKVESTTDPDARLYKKATADKAVPSYQGHALTENRNGLVVAAEATLAATVAEREAALNVGPDGGRRRANATGAEDHAGRRHAVPGRGFIEASAPARRWLRM
jgi:hypothetical protein